MPNPVGNDLRVDMLATNMSIGYTNAEYIADQIAPIVPVQLQSGIIPAYTQSAWFRDAAKLRAPGTKSQGDGWSVDNTNLYFCPRYSLRKEIDDETRGNAVAPYNNLDRDAVQFVTDKLQMRRDVAWAAANFKTTVWGADKVGSSDFTQWSDYGGSTPLVDITNYMTDVQGRIGRDPNTLVMGRQVWDSLKWSPDLIDLVKYVQKGVLSTDLVASMLGIDRILIGNTIYTTSPEGTAESSVSYTRVWGKHALLLYVPTAPSLMNPAASYTFVWQRDGLGGSALQYFRRMRDEEREVDILEGNSYFTQLITASRAADFLQNCVA